MALSFFFTYKFVQTFSATICQILISTKPSSACQCCIPSKKKNKMVNCNGCINIRMSGIDQSVECRTKKVWQELDVMCSSKAKFVSGYFIEEIGFEFSSLYLSWTCRKVSNFL